MPRGAADQRSDERAAMEAVLHQRRIDPRVRDWLEAIPTDGLSEQDRLAVTHLLDMPGMAWAKVEGGRYYMSRAQYDSCYEQ